MLHMQIKRQDQSGFVFEYKQGNFKILWLNRLSKDDKISQRLGGHSKTSSKIYFKDIKVLG